MNDIKLRLRKVICHVFSLAEAQLPAEPSQQNIADWDSLGHIKLIFDVEREFGVRFHTDQIPQLTSIQLIEKEIRHAGK